MEERPKQAVGMQRSIGNTLSIVVGRLSTLETTRAGGRYRYRLSRKGDVHGIGSWRSQHRTVRNGKIAMRMEMGMRSEAAAIGTIRCIPLSSSWSDTASGFVDGEEKRKNGRWT
jgi:hypothetical protein